MNQKSIYISGKITGLSKTEAFELQPLELNEYDIVVNPMKLVPYNPDLTWHDYMVKDIEALLKCDAIYMLKNWGDSRGARIEYVIAKEMGLKIYFQL